MGRYHPAKMDAIDWAPVDSKLKRYLTSLLAAGHRPIYFCTSTRDWPALKIRVRQDIE